MDTQKPRYEYPDVLTPSQVDFVRRLRVEEGRTWRGVARRCHDEWPDADWDPPNDQAVGMELCERAAHALGEDWRREPWN